MILNIKKIYILIIIIVFIMLSVYSTVLSNDTHFLEHNNHIHYHLYDYSHVECSQCIMLLQFKSLNTVFILYFVLISIFIQLIKLFFKIVKLKNIEKTLSLIKLKVQFNN